MSRQAWPLPSAMTDAITWNVSFLAILAMGCWFAFSSSKACRLNSEVSRRCWPMPPASMAIVPLEMSVNLGLARLSRYAPDLQRRCLMN